MWQRADLNLAATQQRPPGWAPVPQPRPAEPPPTEILACAFHGGTHHNFGTFEDWRDPKALLTAAIRHAADYGIQNPYGGPVAPIPMPDEPLAAGWYLDPLYVDASPFGGLARSRYWHGAVWTSAVRTRAK